MPSPIITAVIELLEHVQRRPWAYIGTEPHNIIPFISGVTMTCVALGIQRDEAVYADVVQRHGWAYGSVKPWDEMRARGFDDERMMREFVALEIAAWTKVNQQ